MLYFQDKRLEKLLVLSSREIHLSAGNSPSEIAKREGAKARCQKKKIRHRK